jgi:hypothetical protein
VAVAQPGPDGICSLRRHGTRASPGTPPVGRLDFFTSGTFAPADLQTAIPFLEDGESKSFPEPLKKKLRAAARNASPVPVPEISYASIVASAAAVGR